MPDKTYCYPNTNTLVNKLNIRNEIPANIKLIKTRTFSDCQNLRYLKLECNLDAVENINVFDYCSDDLQIELSTGEIISLEELDNLLDKRLIEDNEISR